MKLYLKQYLFKVRTLSPVFIGSGTEVGKKEYIYNRNNNTVSFLDMRKLYKGLMQKRLMPAFTDYMLREHNDLYSFFRNNHVSPSVYQPWISYTVKMGDQHLINRSTKGIQLFMKDPYGQPYVPGSSLKGALRTVLQSAWYLNHPDQADRIAGQIQNEARRRASRTRYMSSSDRRMSTEVFHSQMFPEDKTRLEDAINDRMRGLIIGDSRPLKTDDLCVCQKVDMNTVGTEKPMPMLRECLRPGVTMEFQVTLDPDYFPYTVVDIIKALNTSYEYYQKIHIKGFQKAPKIPAASDKKGRKLNFFLGGGVGYVSKTTTYAALNTLDEHEAKRQVGQILNAITPSRHNHQNDADKGASPAILKCTKYNGNTYQMGACYLCGARSYDIDKVKQPDKQ